MLTLFNDNNEIKSVMVYFLSDIIMITERITGLEAIKNNLPLPNLNFVNKEEQNLT